MTVAAASIHIYAGWAATGVVALGYALSLLRRGRAASARVPEDKRRWSSSS
ncbi:MAG TPA: hypothetical protein VFK43_10100 [Acidimicrobiales bacterium]|nr:hypothetical protein [Acidimicrobiales bacterium]